MKRKVKVVTSGIKGFTSTGAEQELSFPITMPIAEGKYPVWLDVYVEGALRGAYVATEDVIVRKEWLTSGITVVNANIPTWAGEYFRICSIDVTYRGEASVVCTVQLYQRKRAYGSDWTPWYLIRGYDVDGSRPWQAYYESLRKTSATISPGETVTFSEVVDASIPKATGTARGQVKFVGPFGEVISEEFRLFKKG